MDGTNMISFGMDRLKNRRRASGALLLLLTIVILGSCNGPRSYRWLYYNETYCGDSWTYDANNEVLKQNVTNHLKTKSIVIYDLEIYTDRDPEQFGSCYNKTGRRIKCKIKKGDLNKLKAEGFYE